MSYESDLLSSIFVRIAKAIEYSIENGVMLAVTPEIHIGDVHLLNAADAKINPNTEENGADAVTELVQITPAVEATQAAVEKSTADTASVLYDGGGTGDDLVEYADDDALIAGVGNMTVIDCDGMNALDIFVGNSVAAQTGTVLVSEYSTATPTVATLIRQTPVNFLATDTKSVDRSVFGLAAPTKYPTKTPQRISVTPGSFVLLSLSDDLAGGLWYARYQLHGSV